MSHSKFDLQEADEEKDRPGGNNESPSNDEAAEAELFYKRLKQTGRLVDVDETTDLASLPPHITHIRRPNGTIERIGFS
jgi:hypothetical protein